MRSAAALPLRFSRRRPKRRVSGGHRADWQEEAAPPPVGQRGDARGIQVAGRRDPGEPLGSGRSRTPGSHLAAAGEAPAPYAAPRRRRCDDRDALPIELVLEPQIDRLPRCTRKTASGFHNRAVAHSATRAIFADAGGGHRRSLLRQPALHDETDDVLGKSFNDFDHGLLLELADGGGSIRRHRRVV
jgi:hypothetical protein